MSSSPVLALAALVLAGALVVGVPASTGSGSAESSGSSAAGPSVVSSVVPWGATARAPDQAAPAVRPPADGGLRDPVVASGVRDGPRRPTTRPWRWPLAPKPTVLRRFRAPPSPWAAGHRGLDLATSPGVEVLAVADGTVTHAGRVAGRGTVTITHASGLRSTYEPVEPTVRSGDVVARGAVIGVVDPPVGTSHCGARVCLHLGARRGDGYVDPWPLLAGGRLALLPLR